MITTTAKDGKRYPLTLKQQNFCHAYLECEGNQSAAYRQAYNAGNMSAEAIRVEASLLMDNPNVAIMIESLQSKARERHETTVDSLTEKLRESYQDAKTNGQTSVQVAAVMGEAKLHGLLVDKTEDVTKPSDMTAAELAAESERIQAELDKLDNVVGILTKTGT